MRVRSIWGSAALVAWPAVVWAQQPGPGATPAPNAPGGQEPVNVGSAKLPDLIDPADGTHGEPEPAPAPVTRLLGPNDNPYRGPSVPGSASYENPYRGPSLKPPYDNPYRGPSPPAESVPPGASQPPTPPVPWGQRGYCPPGSPCRSTPLGPPGPDRGARPSAGGRSAAEGSPFIDAVSGAFLLRERVSTPLAFGGQLGGFVLERVRLSARALVPIANPSDEMPGQSERASRSVWLWGFGAGLVVADSATFTLAPGPQYAHVSGGPHGDAVGVQVPFEWLFDSGLRLGFDFSVLYGFGGSYRSEACSASFGNSCVEASKSRPGAPGVALNLILGQAFTSSEGNRSP